MLFGCCVKLALSLREELGLRVFENRVLSVIFGCGREEVKGGWRNMHKEKFHNFSLSDFVRIKSYPRSRSCRPIGL
jgi:hypothetical protein